MGAVSIMVVAGEASGDLHGAGLCAAIRTLSPGARVFGMGGERMRTAGAELLADVSRRATVGGTEAVSGVPALYRTTDHSRCSGSYLSTSPSTVLRRPMRFGHACTRSPNRSPLHGAQNP